MKANKFGKKTLATLVLAGVLSLGVAAYAAESLTPAEIAAQLTGKTVEAVQAERAAGKTYGTIAKDADKLEEFQAQMLESKKALLDAKVKAGTLTQAEADAIYEAMKTAQATCDGTGTARIGRMMGAGFGQGCGLGGAAGSGFGIGRMGQRMGAGMGMGRGLGSGMHR